ncbi:hypothetical protein ABZP36_010616 [Zizania latifolia]
MGPTHTPAHRILSPTLGPTNPPTCTYSPHPLHSATFSPSTRARCGAPTPSRSSPPAPPPAAAATTTASSTSYSSSPCSSPSPPQSQPRRRRRISSGGVGSSAVAAGSGCGGGGGEEVEAEDVWRGAQWEAAWPRRAKPVVVAEEPGSGGGGGGGASTPVGDDGVGRARSLTDDDLEELKGCVDLGFGFSYDEIPELCGTLPALELCYSMSQRFLDEHHPLSQSPPETTAAPSTPSPPIPNWKISSPGDSPDEVKARLKYWAQAVACTVRLCS